MIVVAARRDLIYYSDLVNEIDACKLIPWGSQLAHLLGRISTEEHGEGRGMLSVVVVRKEDKMPGTGFFDLARLLGQHVDDDKTFWDQELAKVYEIWSSVPKT